MNELRINQNKVSHIEIYDETKGVISYWNGNINYVWMEADYFKFLWIFKTKLLNYSEGYYRNSKRKWITNDTPIELKNHHFVKDKFVYTLPRIKIYLGSKLIEEMYFESLKSAKDYCRENFPNAKLMIDKNNESAK